MVRVLGLAAAKGLAAGSLHHATGSVVALTFGFVAAVAIVAIAVFGCTDHEKKEPGYKKKEPVGRGPGAGGGGERVDDGDRGCGDGGYGDSGGCGCDGGGGGGGGCNGGGGGGGGWGGGGNGGGGGAF